MPFPTYLPGHFQLINTEENAMFSCLIYISSVIGRVQC